MKNKNNILKLKRGYTKIPTKLFQVGLKPELIGLYCYLVNQSEDFNPSVRTIAKDLNIGNNTAGKYMRELVDRNIINLVRGHNLGRPAEYEFTKPDEWK